MAGQPHVKIKEMIAILALAALAHGNQAARPKPSALVSLMLAHYNGANTMVGRLEYTQAAMDKAIHGQTDIQYERPNKLYIKQNVDQPQMTARLVCDGNRFLYTVPQDTRQTLYALGGSNLSTNELVENAAQWNDDKQATLQLDLGQIYAIGGSG